MTNEKIAIKLPKSDIAPLIMRLHQGQVHPQSLWKQYLTKGMNNLLSQETETFLRLPEFQTLVHAISYPDLSLTQRMGGGALGLEEINFFFTLESQWILVSPEEEYLKIQSVGTTDALLKEFVLPFINKNVETAPNFLPPPISLEDFVLILHLIDSYRRITYENLLSHQFSKEMTMDLETFFHTMTDSIKNRDMRWLLPAFMILVPHLKLSQTDKENPLLSLLTNKLVIFGKNNRNRDVIQLQDPARFMGIEFMTSWYYAIGMELAVYVANESKALSTCFIAPTAETNHLMLIDEIEEEMMVRHLAYTEDMVHLTLENILEEGIQLIQRSYAGLEGGQNG